MTKQAHEAGQRTTSEAESPSRDPLRFWRTLGEQADAEALIDQVAREFPHLLPLVNELPHRRQFLTLLGASLALAGITGCEQRPSERILPYVRQPEQIVPGRPLYFASAALLDGYARGVLVESHMGRPTKIEGNPMHPASLGASDVFMQAETLTLYDPDRTQTVFFEGEINTWENLLAALRPALAREEDRGGAGLRLLTGNITSPTLERQIAELLEMYPEARWHQWQAMPADNIRHAAEIALGEPAEITYRFDQADVIVALDADFLAPGPASIRYARDFMTRRRGSGPPDQPPDMNRLYVIESTLSITGAFADHRLPVVPQRVGTFALQLARQLGVDLGNAAPPSEGDVGQDSEIVQRWVEAIARDLTENREPGRTLILAGPEQPPAVHALALAINEQLGNIGRTVVARAPITGGTTRHVESLRELVDDMQAGNVDVLIIIGTNPVFTAPADLPLKEAFERVALRVHMGMYYDETSEACHWHVPASHVLETWGDARAFDGTVTFMQPLIAPLYNSKTPYELLAVLTGHPERSTRDIVQQYWREQWGDEFDVRWATALHDGLVEASASEELDVRLQPNWNELLAQLPSSATNDLTVVFRPDPTVWDGDYANNAWLQELPKPFTKLTWDNAVLLGPATASSLNLENGQIVRLEHAGRSLEVPVWITPGIPADTATLYLGNGHQHIGNVGAGRGFNAYRLRASDSLGWAADVQIKPTGNSYPLVCTQEHHLLHGRDLIRAGTLEQWRADPEHPEFMGHPHEPHEKQTLKADWKYEGYKWGMSIDVGACIGCNACVVACQAENNIPVVGKEQVAMGREMHWLRVDTYYTGDAEQPRTFHQPLPCMHCEHAPCEIVCPVTATVHSSEGINQMVYNRCVGTRYCSNNCPYKVRRFNFLQYTDLEVPVLKLLRNPDVTVRSLGVMEKCTYCTQRISHARIEAEKQGRLIREDELLTACQQACPTNAIVFGDLNQPTHVRELQDSPRDYGLLVELNTRPRTRYLAAVKNLNPALGDRLS